MSLQDGRKVIAFDFDGVLHEYAGWNEGRLGNAMPGMVEVVRLLQAKGAHVVVHTTRAVERIAAWMVAQGYGPLDVYNVKWSRIDLFVDDRAREFRPDLADHPEAFVLELLRFEPHWRRQEGSAPRRGDAGAYIPKVCPICAVTEMVCPACEQFVPVRPCRANRTMDPPQDCDMPFCGCNPAWQVAIEALQEIGWGPQAPAPRSARGGGDADAKAVEIIAKCDHLPLVGACMRCIAAALQALTPVSRLQADAPDWSRHHEECRWYPGTKRWACHDRCPDLAAVLEIAAPAAALRKRGPSAYPFGGLAGLLREVEQSLRSHGAECLNPESCGPLGCLLAKIHHQRVALEGRAPASPSASEAGGGGGARAGAGHADREEHGRAESSGRA